MPVTIPWTEGTCTCIQSGHKKQQYQTQTSLHYIGWRRGSKARLKTSRAVATSHLQQNIEDISSNLPIKGWPLYLFAASVAAVGSYTALQILIWDYKNRRTDDPNEEDRSSSYSIKPTVVRDQGPADAKAYNWDTTSYKIKPRESSQAANRAIAAEAAQSVIQTIRDAQEVSKAAEVLLLLGDKGLCEPSTLRMLQALTAERGGVPSAGSPVLKRVVNSMAQEQAIAQIRRCLEAVHTAE